MLVRAAAAAREEPQPGRVAVGIEKEIVEEEAGVEKGRGRERERERKGREGLREEVESRGGAEGVLISFCIPQKHFTIFLSDVRVSSQFKKCKTEEDKTRENRKETLKEKRREGEGKKNQGFCCW